MPFITIAKIEDVLPGKGKCIQVGNKSIALFRIDEKFYALDDYCPHQGAPIANGYLTAKDITCTWHGATFDLATGKGLSGPCGGGITPYSVRVVDDAIEIDVAEDVATAFLAKSTEKYDFAEKYDSEPYEEYEHEHSDAEID